MASPDESRSVILRLYDEALNQGNFEKITDELVAPDAVMHHAPYHDQTGPEVLKATWRALHEAFDDLHFEVESLLVDGDVVAVRGTTTGTHTGTFAGTGPTGLRVSERAHVFYRLDEQAKVTEIWPMVDRAGLLQQLKAG
ncbi:ester cyclase [Streptomyces sp. IBSBF 2953]|uniref:Lct37 n=1 Tax=Streptomyces rishiriensis TaxID=68264 RepID=B0LJ20_STRRH|nr:ester cyclase [Streptomyces scabiei]ABX71120.1 Lct37 [Streptomyces rishiriensis]MCQ9184104.1 ester cyclase [Streptomyces hayashii]MDX3117004.1 ester cyclase [Streptomyces scabiei]